MKMTHLVTLSALILGTLAIGTASAEGKGMKTRARNENAHMQQGVKSGSLTRDEAKELRQERRQIRQMARESAQDGMTKEERKQIRQGQKEHGQNIYEAKHNEEVSTQNQESEEVAE